MEAYYRAQAAALTRNENGRDHAEGIVSSQRGGATHMRRLQLVREAARRSGR